MNLRRHLLLLLMLALLHALPTAARAEAMLRLGGFIVEPLLIGRPDEPIQGALPRFIEDEIAPQTRIRFIWTPSTSYARAIQSLRDGSLDILLLDMKEIPHGADIGEFSWHYLEVSPHLAVNPTSPLREVLRLEELAGLQIAWLHGPTVPAELATVPIQWQWTSGRDWQSVNLRMLSKGRVDAAYFGNALSPVYVARREHLPIRLVRLPMRPTRFTMFYSLHADKAAVAEFERLAQQAFKGLKFRQLLETYGN